MDLQSNSHPSDQNHGLSTLSCQECRRRKTKCDRQLPTCMACMNLAIACIYPDGPLKPGPKPGVIRRSKRRRLDASSPSPAAFDTEPRSVLSHRDSSPNIAQSFTQDQTARPNIDGGSHTASSHLTGGSNGQPGHSIASQSPDQSSINTHRRLSLLIHPNHEPKSQASDSVEAPTLDSSTDQSTASFIPESLMGPVCRILRMDKLEIDYL